MLQKFQIQLTVCERVTWTGQAGNKFVMTKWRILNSNKDQMQEPDGKHANNAKDFPFAGKWKKITFKDEILKLSKKKHCGNHLVKNRNLLVKKNWCNYKDIFNGYFLNNPIG